MNLIRSATKTKWAFPLFLGVITFLMMLSFSYGQLFVSDEVEIFLKGEAIAQGQILYKEIGSQHMPVMYFIAALFALVGVQTSLMFRLCFYIFFAAVWTLIGFRYRDRFGRKLLTLIPVIYLAILPTISMGTCVLSEQAQAVSMVILGLELLQFRTDKPISLGSCVMISFAVLLSFGSAFVSIFAIFAIGLTVLIMEILAWIKEKRGFFKGIGYLFARYWKLIAIVAAPFTMMVVYFKLNGALSAFIGWAYTINREVYPKYVNGYGSSILVSMIGGLRNLAEPFTNLSFSLDAMIPVLLMLLAVIGLVYLATKTKNTVLVGGLLFFLVTAATRGVFNFHGLSAVAVLSLYSAVAMLYVIDCLSQPSCSITKRSVAILLAFVMAIPFTNNALYAMSVKNKSMKVSPPLTDAIDLITEDGEKIGFTTTNYGILLDSHTVPASVTGGSCPWLWEFGGHQAMQELTANPPRVFYFNRDIATWGYEIKHYAPALFVFIEEHYTNISPAYGEVYQYLYIRNDYFDEAMGMLNLPVVAVENETDPVDDSTDTTAQNDVSA